MIKEIFTFLRSLTIMSWLRMLMALVLTNVSVILAFNNEATINKLIGFSLITLFGIFYMEYKNYKTRR
jgi:uncharacterized integral membrane protein